MEDRKVNHVFGWDIRSLPVELEVWKELGTDSVSQIERMDIDRSNDARHTSVPKYTNGWQNYVHCQAC